MSQTTVDHQTARRKTAMWMFVILVFGVVILVAALVDSTRFLPDDDFARGIILTAIAGSISAFLWLIGLILKGLVDNLTGEDPTQSTSLRIRRITDCDFRTDAAYLNNPTL